MPHSPVSFRLDPKLIEAARSAAEQRGLSLARWISDAITRHLESPTEDTLRERLTAVEQSVRELQEYVAEHVRAGPRQLIPLDARTKAVRLYYQHRLTIAEIAIQLAVSEGTVSRILREADPD